MESALTGTRVLTCEFFQQGPSASGLLADYGAEVIKIEPPGGGDPGRAFKRIWGVPLDLGGGLNAYFETLNRNKKSIVLDLKQDAGKQVLFRLIKNSDVFMHNFRQGVAERLGVDYKNMSIYNPKLIYAVASGWGTKGPGSPEPSFDYLGQARSGLMMAASADGISPNLVAGGISDEMGAIMLAFGVLLALVARQSFGVGQEIHSSHLSSAMALLRWNFGMYLMTGIERAKQVREEVPNPLTNHYRASDGKWLAMSHPQSDRYWPVFCKATGIVHLQNDPRFSDMDTREQNSKELIAILDKVFIQKTREEWLKILRAEDLIVCSVNSFIEASSDPQTIANEYITDFIHPVLGKIKMLAPPVEMSKTPGSIRMQAPQYGQHTEEVLLEVGGYSWEEIGELKEAGVIG